MMSNNFIIRANLYFKKNNQDKAGAIGLKKVVRC